MKWIAIAAVARNGVIGNENRLPWHLPEDLKFFRESTREHIVLMGRKTFESLGKPLPHRLNWVVSRNSNWRAAGVEVFQSLEHAVNRAQEGQNFPEGISKEKAFVIGGAQIYRDSIQWIHEAWITEIDQDFLGDSVFPEYKNGVWQASGFVRVQAGEEKIQESTGLRFRFSRYMRKKTL